MKPITDEWVRIAEGDWETANRENLVEENTNYRAVSFHAQQCGEKYLKAVLQENGVNPERTHDLEILLNKILPILPAWADLDESCAELTDFAVQHRYPGTSTTQEDAADALKYAAIIRERVRHYLLPNN